MTDVRRGLIQTLQGWQLGGLTHLKQVEIAAPAKNEVARPEVAVPAKPLMTFADLRRANKEGPAPTVSPLTHNSPAEVASPLQPVSLQPVSLQPVSLQPVSLQPAPLAPSRVAAAATALSLVNDASMKNDRAQQLCQLAAKVANCVKCTELANTRTQTVFGVGDPHAKILFVGEAPGADEDLTGEPFVGKAGQLLNKIIAACGFKREEIYICNVLRCRPPGNRTPSPEEATNCREFLDGQISIVAPEYIVCWGSSAAINLLNSTETIGKLRGRFYEYNGAKVLCTYHPSYLLRNPSAKKQVWEDMLLLLKEMGLTPPPVSSSTAS